MLKVCKWIIRLISIDPIKDREIEFSLKAHTFVEAKHLEIDENVEKHKLFASVVECKIFILN